MILLFEIEIDTNSQTIIMRIEGWYLFKWNQYVLWWIYG